MGILKNIDSKFRIFYSWQSDLPGNENRYFIKGCIDNAAKHAKEILAIDAERDEATNGVPGSPDIVTTILDKIDNSDLFIADVSICYRCDREPQKHSPNPNVMFELGYALNTLGWDRIICIWNTDFGDELPFDISHNRMLKYSLKNNNRGMAGSKITNAILQNIEQIRDQPPIARKGNATHIVGSYNLDKGGVEQILSSTLFYDNLSHLTNEKESLLAHANSTYNEIIELTKKIRYSHNDETGPNFYPLPKSSLDSIMLQSSAIKAYEDLVSKNDEPVQWICSMIDQPLIEKFINKRVPDDFFDLGALKSRVVSDSSFFPNTVKTEIIGTDAEKEKFQKLGQLSNTLLKIEIEDYFIDVCKNVCYLPVAIQNVSSKNDHGIKVVVYVDIGEIINPKSILLPSWIFQFFKISSSDFGNLKPEFFKDVFYETVSRLFTLPDDGNISIEKDPEACYTPKRHDLLPGYSSYDFSDAIEDCEEKLEEHFTIAENPGFYRFQVATLQPKECKWLGQGIFVKPMQGKIKLRYQIKSANSDGNLSGVLEPNNHEFSDDPSVQNKNTI